MNLTLSSSSKILASTVSTVASVTVTVPTVTVTLSTASVASTLSTGKQIDDSNFQSVNLTMFDLNFLVATVVS